MLNFNKEQHLSADVWSVLICVQMSCCSLLQTAAWTLGLSLKLASFALLIGMANCHPGKQAFDIWHFERHINLTKGGIAGVMLNSELWFISFPPWTAEYRSNHIPWAVITGCARVEENNSKILIRFTEKNHRCLSRTASSSITSRAHFSFFLNETDGKSEPPVSSLS